MKWVENLWWNQNIPPCFGEGLLYNIRSVEDGLVERCLYINFKSFLLVQNHPDLSKTEWAVLWLSSFSIFPARLHEVQLLMSRLQQQFLRSQHDRWIRFPYEKQHWPPRANYQNGQVLLSSSFQLCTMSPFKTIIPIILDPSQLKPWGDIKETNIKKIQFRNEENWKVYNTPSEHLK